MSEESTPPKRRPTGAQPTTSQNRFAAQRATGSTRSGSASTTGPSTGATTERTAQTSTSSSRGGGGGAGGTRKTKVGKPPKPPKPRWVRILRGTLIWGAVAGFILTSIVFVGSVIKYSSLQIPTPDDFAQAQASTIYYSDGVTVMGRLGVANRENVAIETLPEHVPHAVVAAEDRTFYTNPGVDFLGMIRAMFKTVVLGKKQGGSTITQQYVERYYVGETTTDLVGKWEEALLALKIDHEQEKDAILENYLNTIYLGRGAYGIQAAAREYYGKDAASLSVSEAAMIAGLIPAPSRWDPRNNHEQAVARWNYVLDGMVELGYLEQSVRGLLTFPEPIPYANADVYAGPQGYLLRAAVDEVAERAGITPEDVETRGYSIVTTIDPPRQAATEAAAATVPTDHSPNLQIAIVTINPATGAITSMYGGADYLTRQRNAVTQDIAQAGSTFKPFALAAALENGIALESQYLGDSPLPIEGFQRPVENFGNTDFGQIDLIKATASSVNTVYAQVTHDVGPDVVMRAAIRAGLPEDTAGLEANPANVLGTASPHPLDMAAAYATFASGGWFHEPYLVETVTDPSGNVAYSHILVESREFSSAVIADLDYALQQVVNSGSGNHAARLGRPIAGKTGTSSDNKSAWFIGYTPQIVGAVALYQVAEDGSAESITPFGGYRQITGGSVPVRVWATMMETIFASLPVEYFPPRSYIGEVILPSIAPSPSPSASPSASPSVSPTTVPSPSASGVPSPTPVPSPSTSGP